MLKYRKIEGAPYVLTLGSGSDLFNELKNFFYKEGWKEGWIMNALGSLGKIALRYPKDKVLPPTIEEATFEGVFEIVSLSGSVKTRGEKIQIHLHGSFSQKGREMYGGAIGPGSKVFKEMEILLFLR